MAAAPKENLGRMPCPCCGCPTALKRSGTQKLSYVCDDADCEMSGYANPGTGAARKWLGKVQRRQAPDQAPATPARPAKVEQKPDQDANNTNTEHKHKPAPRAGFDLGALLGVRP